MPDWKSQWPSLLYKVLMAVLAIVFGVGQYKNLQEHKKFSQMLHSCGPKAVALKSSDVVYLHGNKPIKLMRLADETIKETLSLTAEKQYNGVVKPFVKPAVDLGMNGVPVLDQGQEGTCVTFSTTASLDAIIGEGDLISQQCSLMLDDALGQNYWDGAYYPSQIIQPLQQYGVVSQVGCPVDYPDSSQTIDIATYQSLVCSSESAIVQNVEYEYFAAFDLNALKTAIQQGHRVLIGFHVYAGAQQAVQGFDVNGNVGGLWACKQGKSANYCKNSNAGHEVVVIGYDDKQQLLKIRNSWGVSVGEEGDYYMTYTFASSMIMDMTIIK